MTHASHRTPTPSTGPLRAGHGRSCEHELPRSSGGHRTQIGAPRTLHASVPERVIVRPGGTFSRSDVEDALGSLRGAVPGPRMQRVPATECHWHCGALDHAGLRWCQAHSIAVHLRQQDTTARIDCELPNATDRRGSPKRRGSPAQFRGSVSVFSTRQGSVRDPERHRVISRVASLAVRTLASLRPPARHEVATPLLRPG